MTTASAATDDLLLQPMPFLSSVLQIEPQWIDYNGHLNMAYYNVMFDRAIDELWLKLGIGPGYMKARHGSTFTAECHVRYLREVHLGDPVQVSILLVAADEKRLHTFEELRHASEGWLSATSSVACGNTTASGGWLSIQVVVWPCCSRTACEVTRRLP